MTSGTGPIEATYLRNAAPSTVGAADLHGSALVRKVIATEERVFMTRTVRIVSGRVRRCS